MSEAKQATPHAELIAQLLDSRVPKTEREHAASREVERLRAEVAGLLEDAERYRYLRDISRRDCLLLEGPEAGVWCGCEDEHGELVLLTESDLDAAIDAARKGEA